MPQIIPARRTPFADQMWKEISANVGEGGERLFNEGKTRKESHEESLAKSKFEKEKELIKLKESEKLKGKKDFFNEQAELLQGLRSNKSPRSEQMLETEEGEGEGQTYTDQQKELISLMNPQLAKQIQEQDKEKAKVKRHNQDIELAKAKDKRKEELDFDKRSEGYDEELLTNYKTAIKQQDAIKEAEKAIKSGKVNPGSLTNFFKGMGSVGDKLSKALISKDQATVQALIPEFLEGRKELFGVRLSDADLALLQDKMVDIGKTSEANMAILKLAKKYSELSTLRYQIGKKIKEENKKLRPLGYQDLIEERFEQMTKPIKIKNPHTGNVVEIPAYKIGPYITDGGEIIEE
jgi:hypothetical protein